MARGIVVNACKVPARQWKKWSNAQRVLFNDVYFTMKDQSLFTHPDQECMTMEHWTTIRWNAAFTAASEAEGLK